MFGATLSETLQSITSAGFGGADLSVSRLSDCYSKTSAKPLLSTSSSLKALHPQPWVERTSGIKPSAVTRRKFIARSLCSRSDAKLASRADQGRPCSTVSGNSVIGVVPDGRHVVSIDGTAVVLDPVTEGQPSSQVALPVGRNFSVPSKDGYATVCHDGKFITSTSETHTRTTCVKSFVSGQSQSSVGGRLEVTRADEPHQNHGRDEMLHTSSTGTDSLIRLLVVKETKTTAITRSLALAGVPASSDYTLGKEHLRRKEVRRPRPASAAPPGHVVYDMVTPPCPTVEHTENELSRSPIPATTSKLHRRRTAWPCGFQHTNVKKKSTGSR